MLLILHAHVAPKIIKIICVYSKISGYIYKNGLVFKNKSIKFDKWSLNTGITKYFLFWQTISASQTKFRVHFLMVQLDMAPLKATHFISTCGFFGRETWSLPSINILVNSHFEFSFPDCSLMCCSTLWTNPFLSLLTNWMNKVYVYSKTKFKMCF